MTTGAAVVLYTTRYRDGGDKFARVAKRLSRDLESSRRFSEVFCHATETKADFTNFWRALTAAGKLAREFHFVGHSGMYGIMFGTRQWPEQFSPAEWRMLDIPFTPDASAYFHACRTARWFAPFFAHTYDIITYGHYFYTTFSASLARFRHPFLAGANGDLFCISTVGRRSHGYLGSFRKYILGASAIPMTRFEPADFKSRNYDRVASLYANAFPSIRSARPKEWNWLTQRITDFPRSPVVCDIGCGNGALLRDLAPFISSGIGLDVSREMVTVARKQCRDYPHLSFLQVEDPIIPLESGSVDLAISLLSMRYLDWDPVMLEIKRVLRPDGRLLLIDMAASPLRIWETPRYVAGRLCTFARHLRSAESRSALRQLVRSPEWQEMLRYNPMRAEHEYKWYLQGRFPCCSMQTLDVGRTAKVLAFDSGPICTARLHPQSYP